LILQQSGVKLSELLSNEIDQNADILLSDNDKYTLFQDYVYKPSLKGRINHFLRLVIPDRYYYRFLLNYRFSKHLDGLNYLYDRLKNEDSKLLLIQVLAYRILDYKKYNLPLRNQKYIDNHALIEALVPDKNDFIDPRFRNFKLFRHELDPIGYKMSIYFSSGGVLTDFVVKQYEYHSKDCVIKAEKDDVVIDAGACWGDTALYFAHEVGENGKVFSFEFIPGNIEILMKNVSINPHLADRIEVVPNPIWQESGLRLYYNDLGPASRVSEEKFPDSTGEVETLSIDDFVKQRDIKKVNFIKMDIEGAELSAVKGAANTIVNHRPKLAISVYHSISDFYTIAKYIDSLQIRYEFYFKHATIHGAESVLFGKPVS